MDDFVLDPLPQLIFQVAIVDGFVAVRNCEEIDDEEWFVKGSLKGYERVFKVNINVVVVLSSSLLV